MAEDRQQPSRAGRAGLPDHRAREREGDQRENLEPRRDNTDAGHAAEGRDRPPSDRGRDPDGPWLGGG
jgi:hypothetical protein